MLRLFNTLGKQVQKFEPEFEKKVTIFTCGPSVYQRSHIGNFRTFLFEDLLVRYLIYCGYQVRRGMNFTDVEDKAIEEAAKLKTTIERLSEKNITIFLDEMKSLRIRIPDYLPRASECVQEAAQLISQLIEKKVAYRYRGNVYFDALKYPGFGKLYGLDMSKWPRKKRRFHKDTYPGMRWNLGDFILWHRHGEGDKYSLDTAIGRGRPAWNIQDASMVSKYFHETLSFYCGGIDNLFRHHDYTLAILESVRPYPMAQFWLHCHHLHVDEKKMSKSKGNIIYIDDLRKSGYTMEEIRFFLIYGHYRETLNYSDQRMREIAEKLREIRSLLRRIEAHAKNSRSRANADTEAALQLKEAFVLTMDNDLRINDAFDKLHVLLEALKIEDLKPAEARAVLNTMREIDEVFQVFFT